MPSKKKIVLKPQSNQQEYPTGAKLSFPSASRIQYSSLVGESIKAKVFPEEFSIFNKSLGITNQKYGSCVGASHAKDTEYDENKNGGDQIRLSYRWAYAMCKKEDGNTDEGTYPATMAKIRSLYGIPPESMFPSTGKFKDHTEFITIPKDLEEALLAAAYEHRSQGFVWVMQNEEVKDILMTHKSPVTATWNTPKDYFRTDSKGRVKDYSGTVGLHRMQIVGWKKIDGEEFWEVQNSWGEDFGKDGRFYIYSSIPIMEGIADIDFVNAQATTGAPINLALPCDKFTLTQAFGADFKEKVNGIERWYYKSRGLAGHPGADCRQSDGQGVVGKHPAYACDEGKVIFAGPRGILGNTVIIQHIWGTSHYNHLDSGSVGVGQSVGKRQKIGMIGKTGDTTGPHIHWAITINGVTNVGFGNFVNPMDYVGNDQPAGGQVTFAKDAGTKLEAFTIKITNPERWEQVAVMYNTEKTIRGKAKDIPTIPGDRGFVFSNKDDKLVIFFLKLPDPNWKNVLAAAHKIPQDSVKMADL